MHVVPGQGRATVNFWPEERLTPSQGGIVSDVLSLEEAWVRFPIAMERANLGIGHLLCRPDFVLRLWDDSRSVLAQASMTPREREGHVQRALLRRDSWPLLIGGVTHGMDRTSGGNRTPSWCGKHRVLKKGQRWLESRDRDVDCMGCLATGRTLSARHSRGALDAMRWVCSVKWMPKPGIWSRYGWSFANHPRSAPGRFEGKDEIPIADAARH